MSFAPLHEQVTARDSAALEDCAPSRGARDSLGQQHATSRGLQTRLCVPWSVRPARRGAGAWGLAQVGERRLIPSRGSPDSPCLSNQCLSRRPGCKDSRPPTGRFRGRAGDCGQCPGVPGRGSTRDQRGGPGNCSRRPAEHKRMGRKKRSRHAPLPAAEEAWAPVLFLARSTEARRSPSWPLSPKPPAPWGVRSCQVCVCGGGPCAAKPPSLLPIIHARLLHAGIVGARVALH